MPSRKKIKSSLLKQLDDNNLKTDFFVDLVNDYMSMWDIKNKLIENIKEMGVSIKYKNGENQYGYKKNDSVRELTTVNNQMLKILKDLGIKAEVKEDDNDEFEL